MQPYCTSPYSGNPTTNNQGRAWTHAVPCQRNPRPRTRRQSSHLRTARSPSRAPPQNGSLTREMAVALESIRNAQFASIGHRNLSTHQKSSRNANATPTHTLRTVGLQEEAAPGWHPQADAGSPPNGRAFVHHRRFEFGGVINPALDCGAFPPRFACQVRWPLTEQAMCPE